MIFFKPLSNEVIKEIVEIQLKNVEKRLKKQDLEISFTPAVKDHLVSIGFDEVYGARPLKRVINEVVVDEIAFQIVEGTVKPLDHIEVDMKSGKIAISVKKPN